MIQEAIITIIVASALFYFAPSHLVDPTHPEYGQHPEWIIILGACIAVSMLSIVAINHYITRGEPDAE